MPRQVLERARRAVTITQLTRDALPVASTSRTTLDGSVNSEKDSASVAWLPSTNARSPGKALYPKLPRPKPIGPQHFYRFAKQLGLKEPPRRIEPEFGSRSRYLEHFKRTLASDLLYMTYDHRLAQHPPPNPSREPRDPLNPYNLGSTKDAGRWEPLLPKARAVTPDEPLELKALHLSFTYLPGYSNKTKLLPVVGALRAITGIQPFTDGEPHRNTGLRIRYTSDDDKRRQMRVGVPIGVSVKLVGQAMQTFIETLVEVVLPRWRNFQGVPLPETWSDMDDAMGVFDWTLPAEAVPLFPQLEINADRYPHFADLRMSFVSSARGAGARGRTLALLSGYRIPLVPHFEQAKEATFNFDASSGAKPKTKQQQSQKKRR